MLRRNARLRREYLYRKSLEGKDREEYERKLKIRRALEGQTLCKMLLVQSECCVPTRPRDLGITGIYIRHMLPEQRASPSRQSCGRRSRHCGTT